MSLKELRASLLLWQGRRVYRRQRYLVNRGMGRQVATVKWKRLWLEAVAMVERRKQQIALRTLKITAADGAKGIVDQAYALCSQVGGQEIYVASAFRAGSITSSGNRSDHASDNSTQAARDIAKRGVDAITGPPSLELDRAAVALGEAFGRKYVSGVRIVDTFHWNGYRIQVIWRTPEYGGHMGHIHCGARRDD